MPSVPADAALATCEKILSYTFTDKILALEALNTAGRGNDILYNGSLHYDVPKNRLMAQFGDVVADFVVMECWMRQHSSRMVRCANTGISWDTLKKNLLSNKALHRRGVELGIDRCILLNPGTTIISTEMVARTMEALLGAVFQEGGVEEVKRVVEGLGLLDFGEGKVGAERMGVRSAL